MPLIDLDGARIHYSDTGLPPDLTEAQAVVFGHGLLFSGWMFEAQIEALRATHRCIAIDWRGQGESLPADGGYDMDTLTLDLVALLDHLGLDAVHYVGLSMGGFVGMRLAARHPERVLTLTLLDTSAGPEDPEKVSKYRLLARVYRLFGMKPVRKQVEPIMFAPGFLTSGRAVIDEWMGRLAKVDRAGMRQAILGVTDRLPIADEIGAITAPTLVVTGADDVATPVHKAEAIAAGIAGSRLEIVPDCGHSSTLEKPDEITALIRSHIVGA